MVVVSGGDNITETGGCGTGMWLSGRALNSVSHFSRPPFHEDHSQNHENANRVALFIFVPLGSIVYEIRNTLSTLLFYW